MNMFGWFALLLAGGYFGARTLQAVGGNLAVYGLAAIFCIVAGIATARLVVGTSRV